MLLFFNIEFLWVHAFAGTALVTVQVYMKIMLRRADNMWRIKPSELKFKNPVTVLGAGA